eukprot:3292176-Amphidinium_carterae.1
MPLRLVAFEDLWFAKSAFVSTVPVAKVPPAGTGAAVCCCVAANRVVKSCTVPCNICSLARPSASLASMA